MASVTFHPEAQDEYEAATAYYAARSTAVADRFESEVERILGLVGAAPASFPPYDDAHRFAVVRRYPYTVVYRVRPDGAFVAAVAHSGRAAGYWQGR